MHLGLAECRIPFFVILDIKKENDTNNKMQAKMSLQAPSTPVVGQKVFFLKVVIIVNETYDNMTPNNCPYTHPRPLVWD